MANKWMFTGLLLMTAITFTVALIEVQENAAVTIQCPLNVQYPTWTGPVGLVNPLTQGQTIREGGLEWVNNRDLRIASAMLKHDGTYTCRDGSGNTRTEEVDVQYFSASAEITTASPESGNQFVFTCTAHSNPNTIIQDHTVSRAIPGQPDTGKSTAHGCQTDPTSENRVKCSLTATGYALKQDNGKDNKCDFIYKGSTRLTLTKKINVIFPPSYVKITGNNKITESNQNKLTLTCSTNASNPVSTLVWRRGRKAMATENVAITSSYNTVILDAEYHAKNISQKIDIVVNRDMDNEMVFCCARHQGKDYCDSVTLDYSVSAAAYVTTHWLTLIAICIATITRRFA